MFTALVVSDHVSVSDVSQAYDGARDTDMSGSLQSLIFIFFPTGLVRLYIAGLPLRSCQTFGAPSVQGSAQSLYFRFR